jgi:hypothetical protein
MEARRRLGPAAAHVLECSLYEHGIHDLGELRCRGHGAPRVSHAEVFVDGRRLTLARWPNRGWCNVAGIPSEGRGQDGHGREVGDPEAGFLYEGDHQDRWHGTSDVWVHGYFGWDWADAYEKVASVDRPAHRVLLSKPASRYGIRVGQRFRWVNVLEELDEPGEYWIDRTRGLLFFWPPATAGRESEVYVSMLETPVVRMEGASHVTLSGFTIECGRADGVVIAGGEACRVLHCELRNLGNTAVVVSGGLWHGVCGCEIHDVGDGGIVLEGGDRKTLRPAGHFAVNNHIHHFGCWSRCYKPAIRLVGVGQRAASNLIHDGPHNAIQINGNDHVIELNEVHSVCRETGDVGAFYMGRDWTERGNVLRHNFFHDIRSGGEGGSMAVYLDDCASGTVIRGNVFQNVERAVFIGGGRDHRVENNIFVDCDRAVHLDARGLDPGAVWSMMIRTTMRERLEAVNAFERPYVERYPGLRDLAAYYRAEQPVPPEGNSLILNICVGGVWLEAAWHAGEEMLEMRDNMIGADPHFVRPERGNFQLREDSPAYRLGFERIPFELIGAGKVECFGRPEKPHNEEI